MATPQCRGAPVRFDILSIVLITAGVVVLADAGATLSLAGADVGPPYVQPLEQAQPAEEDLAVAQDEFPDRRRPPAQSNGRGGQRGEGVDPRRTVLTAGLTRARASAACTSTA